MSLTDKLAVQEDMHVEFRRQYAALCYRHTIKDNKRSIEVLLITSRDTGRWVTPKGWPMANKAPHEVAEQEAYEEAGIKGTVLSVALGQFRYLKRLNDGTSVPCIVELFPLLVRKTKSKFPEAQERIRKWSTPEEAAEMVDESELKSLLLEFASNLSE